MGAKSITANALPLLAYFRSHGHSKTPIVFAEADLASGLLAGDVAKLTFSGGIGTLENSIVPLPETTQLADLERG